VSKRIALPYLLDHNLNTPSECCDCPFGMPDPDQEQPNLADPGEGSYLCALLGNEEVSKRNNNPKCWTFRLPSVWGESPLCRPADWAARAKTELGGAAAMSRSHEPPP
jgi:hypothetical protein